MNNSTIHPSDMYNHDPPCAHVVSTLFTVLLSIVSLSAFIGNFLVIASFIKAPSLKTSTNYYIVNMAVSDFLCACFNWPLYATEGMLTSRIYINEPMASVACKMGMYVRGISQVVSVLNLVLIAVDRYVGIVFPLKVTMLDRGRVRLTLLVLTWIIPVACGVPHFLYTKVVKVDDQTFCRLVWDRQVNTTFNFIAFVLFYCLPLIAMIILYTLIVKTLRNRGPNTSSTLDKTQDQLANKRQKQNQKITKILISIVAAFFICWTPLCVYLSLKMFHPGLVARDKCMVLVALFFYVFPTLSTTINPFILFLFSTNYRQALKSLTLQLCDLFKCRLSPHTSRRIASSHASKDNNVVMTHFNGETGNTIVGKSS
ncbi:hypothetical protein OS493_017441 [Desmophyllum pertusum]|uniref:G-protein coupled receptors family 1 profile domain-containing protein n=1 Tax=Desmophyllum pertusum TaxID=174260 RepID=A0A9X0D3D0_9CNID|nr:hypothetical protein OS493_017441 [Desmophyllum pertusum]